MKKLISLFLAAVLLFGSTLVLPASAEPQEEQREEPAVSEVYLNISAHMTVLFLVEAPEGTESAGLMIEGKRVIGELQEDGRWLVSYAPIYCHQMTDILTVQPWSYTDHRLLSGDSYDFSVVDYAMRLLSEPQIDSKLRTLLVAMLNYGAATQDYFSHNPYNKANAYLSPADRAVKEKTYTAKLEHFEDGELEGVSFYGASLSLSQYLMFNFIINCEGAAYDGDQCRLQVSTSPDFSVTASYPLLDYKDGRFYARTDEIPYESLGERVYVRVIAPNGQCSEAISYSVEVYAGNIMEKVTDPNDLRITLIHSMMAFSDALVAYKSR